MSNPEFLQNYSGETADELFAMAATHRIDSLVLAFEWALQQKAEREGAASLSQVERDVLAIEALEREVNNGGYSQFFFNSSREFAPEIVEALLRIGCPETAAVTQRAIAALGTTKLTPEALEEEILRDDSARDGALNDCDAAYYDLGEPIADRLFRHLEASRSQLRLA